MIENRHRLDFADTMRRPPVACLGVPLKPYAIGHELELLRLRSPFLLLDGMEKILALPEKKLAEALTEAVDVCSQSESDRIETSALLQSRVSILPWNWSRSTKQLRIRLIYKQWQGIVSGCNTVVEAITFWNYLCAGRTGPEYARIDDGTPTVPIGAPEMAVLIQYIRSLPEKQITRHGLSELDYPVALARYEMGTLNEQAGKVRLQPDNTQSFADWCSEQEALLKAGKIEFPEPPAGKEEPCQA
jgi:hypothetical protein